MRRKRTYSRQTGLEEGIHRTPHLPRRPGQCHLRGEEGERTVFSHPHSLSLTQFPFRLLRQGVYLLGTSLARPVIARAMIAVAEREGCQ